MVQGILIVRFLCLNYIRPQAIIRLSGQLSHYGGEQPNINLLLSSKQSSRLPYGQVRIFWWNLNLDLLTC